MDYIKSFRKFENSRYNNLTMINEGASDILYHFTRTNRLYNILASNTLYLTPAVSPSERTDDMNYFMSFSRTKSTSHGYGTQFTQGNSVRIKIDGRKLGNRYKVIPVDYWQYPRKTEFMIQNIGDEMEDRVISNDSEIPNAHQYIIEIDILMGEKGIPSEIISNAKELGITLNIFDNSKDFASGDSTRTVRPLIDRDYEWKPRRAISIAYTLSALVYRDPAMKNRISNALESDFGYTKEEIERIYKGSVKDYTERLDYLRPNDDYNLANVITPLRSELHNNKTQSDRLSRFITKELLDDMRRAGTDTIKDYLIYKLYKGRKTQSDFNNILNDKLLHLIDIEYKRNLRDLDYTVYSIDGNELGKLNEIDYVIDFLNEKIDLIKSHVTNITLSNNTMFRFTYMWASSEIRDKVDIKSGADDVVKDMDNVDAEQIIYPIERVLWELEYYADSEIDKIKQKNRDQWRVN